MKNLAELISANDAGEILENIHAMIALIECDGALVSWNRAFESHKAKWPLAKNLRDCFVEAEKTKIDNNLNIDAHDWFVVECGFDGEEKTIFCECMFIPLANRQSLFIAERIDAASSLQEIIEHLNRRAKMFQLESESAKKMATNKQTEVDGVMAQANEISLVDALTFLPNRRRIIRELQDEVLRAERCGTRLSISMADVDFFKNVNDTYGHLTGDEVLRHIGYTLREHIRHPDIAGRYGGEEFLILLPNTVSAQAGEQAERLCKYVRETKVNANDHIISVTISIGVTEFRRGVDTWDSLLNRADHALYDAKKKGRDCWVMAE